MLKDNEDDDDKYTHRQMLMRRQVTQLQCVKVSEPVFKRHPNNTH